MAQGMRHGRSELPPRGMGKADENDGAACTAGKAWQPMLWLSVKPKMPLTWLWVTNLWGVGHRVERVKTRERDKGETLRCKERCVRYQGGGDDE